MPAVYLWSILEFHRIHNVQPIMFTFNMWANHRGLKKVKATIHASVCIGMSPSLWCHVCLYVPTNSSQVLYFMNQCTCCCCCRHLDVTLSDQVTPAFLSTQTKQKTKAIKGAYQAAEDRMRSCLFRPSKT